MSQDCPRMSHMGSSGHPVNPSLQDVPGLSQDVPHGILRTSSQYQVAGCPRTVPGHPSWDPPDIQSTPGCRMSQDCPRTSLMGSSGHPVNPSMQNVPGLSQDVPHGILRTSSQHQVAGCPRTSLMGSARHPVNPSLQDVPGLSQDVPHGILRISSQPQFAGCPRNVLGCPSWDPLDIKSPKDTCRTVQGCPDTCRQHWT